MKSVVFTWLALKNALALHTSSHVRALTQRREFLIGPTILSSTTTLRLCELKETQKMFAAFNIEDYSHRRYSSILKPVNINSMWILINIYVEISQAVWLMWKVVTVNAWERFRQTAVRLCSCPQSNSAESHKSCKRESKSISRSSPPAGVPLPPLWIRWKMFPGSRKCFSSTLLLTRYTNLVERSVKELILQN